MKIMITSRVRTRLDPMTACLSLVRTSSAVLPLISFLSLPGALAAANASKKSRSHDAHLLFDWKSIIK